MAKSNQTVTERFWAKVDKNGPGGCWLWTAGQNGVGYGSFRLGSTLDGTRREVLAHRWVYEALIGPIPRDLTVDHLCRVRNCVNPAHLRLLTNLENATDNGRRLRTHCPHGHPYTEENTLWRDNGRHRVCRECNRQRSSAYYYGHKEQWQRYR
jgi:hypothetical protein